MRKNVLLLFLGTILIGGMACARPAPSPSSLIRSESIANIIEKERSEILEPIPGEATYALIT